MISIGKMNKKTYLGLIVISSLLALFSLYRHYRYEPVVSSRLLSNTLELSTASGITGIYTENGRFKECKEHNEARWDFLNTNRICYAKVTFAAKEYTASQQFDDDFNNITRLLKDYGWNIRPNKHEPQKGQVVYDQNLTAFYPHLDSDGNYCTFSVLTKWRSDKSEGPDIQDIFILCQEVIVGKQLL
jgi:hypothetical protein